MTIPRWIAVTVLVLSLAACGGGSPPPGSGPSSSSPSAVVVEGEVDADAIAQVVAEFDTLDQAAQEQQAAEVDLALERATWDVSGLTDEVGSDQADAVFEEVNAGTRTALQEIAVELGTVTAFGSGAPGRDDLSEAQGASLFGAAMISALSADAAAGLPNGKDTGSVTENGVTKSATPNSGTIETQASSTIKGVAVEISTKTTVQPCPDVSGRTHAEGTMTASSVKNGVGHRFSYSAAVDIQVGDDAEVLKSTPTFNAEQGDAGPGGEQYVAVSLGDDGTYSVDRTRGDLPATYASQAVNGASIMGRLLAYRLVAAAETAWKSGACVKLRTKASSGPRGLRPSELVTVTAAPRSILDGGPVGGTVVASLAGGGASIAPDGTKVSADAEFSYTAPGQPQKTGDVSFEARSRRGIAKATMHFDTYPFSFVAEGGGGEFQGSGRICDLRIPFEISGTGLTLAMTPANEFGGTYTLSGSAGGVPWDGSGTYKVELNESQNSGTLTTKGINTIHSPLGDYSDQAEASFTLRAVRACDD